MVQLLANVILQRHLFRVAIKQITLAWINVAADVDQPEALVFGAGSEIDVHPGKLFLEQVVIGFKGFISEVNPRLIVDVRGRQQNFS